MSVKQRWFVVTLFALAMAWVESAVVYYLRTMIGRIEPYQPEPLPVVGGLAMAEVVREAATMVMLFTVGWLAGKTWRGRFGFTMLAFGIWDIFYYVFLKVMTPWPNSLRDWDILFLIPLPWWGPIWAPMSIALLMILFGILSTWLEQSIPPIWPSGWTGLACLCGIFIALYVFMIDALQVADQGTDALRNLLPQVFHTNLFLIGLGLMAAPVVEMFWQTISRFRDYLPAFPSMLGREQS
ncbi:MAG: hypothetical protein ACO1QB_15895 [Verrucomicrobiales bacterium]